MEIPLVILYFPLARSILRKLDLGHEFGQGNLIKKAGGEFILLPGPLKMILRTSMGNQQLEPEGGLKNL